MDLTGYYARCRDCGASCRLTYCPPNAYNSNEYVLLACPCSTLCGYTESVKLPDALDSRLWKIR